MRFPIKAGIVIGILLTGCNLPSAGAHLSATQSALETEIAGLRATLTRPAPLATLTPTVDLLSLEPVDPKGLAAYFPFSFARPDQRGWGEDRMMEIENPQVTAGARGSALALTDSTTRAVIPAAPGFNLDTGFTLALYYRLEDCAGDCPLLVWGDEQHSGVTLWARTSRYPWPKNSLGVDIVSSISDETSHILTFPAPAASSWVHLALSYDSFSGKARLFLDGELAFEQEIGRFEPQTSYPLWVGRHPLHPAAQFTGAVDELRIYRRVLDADEIRTLARQNNLP